MLVLFILFVTLIFIGIFTFILVTISNIAKHPTTFKTLTLLYRFGWAFWLLLAALPTLLIPSLIPSTYLDYFNSLLGVFAKAGPAGIVLIYYSLSYCPYFILPKTHIAKLFLNSFLAFFCALVFFEYSIHSHGYGTIHGYRMGSSSYGPVSGLTFKMVVVPAFFLATLLITIMAPLTYRLRLKEVPH